MASSHPSLESCSSLAVLLGKSRNTKRWKDCSSKYQLFGVNGSLSGVVIMVIVVVVVVVVQVVIPSSVLTHSVSFFD